MKKIYTIFLLVLMMTNVMAQAPQKMSFQAVIRNASNTLITSQPVGIEIVIKQGSPTGTNVYKEIHLVTTNANGLVSLEIGTGTVLSGVFSSIDWSNGPYFIKTNTDPTGGTSYSITSTTQLTSVPYALFAANSGSTEVPGTAIGDIKYWNGTTWIIIPIGLPGQILKVDSTNIPQWTSGSPLSIVSTDYVNAITAQSATVSGTVSSSGGELVLSRGFCYNTSINPTVSNSVLISGSGIGSFLNNISGLVANTTYYVRAFSTSIAGTAYGSQLSFTTLDGIATLTTTATTTATISACYATSGGTITSNGGSGIINEGVCWSTTPGPTTSSSYGLSGGNPFSTGMTGLAASTTYYYRAFASNSFGTFYGNELSFTTTSGVATLSTASASSVTPCKANVSGIVTYNGGETLTTSGICYATTINPTTSNINIPYYINGANTLTNFTGNLTGLSPNTTYYVRAYTTNCAGTTYGNQVSFTTSSGIATLTTATATLVTACNADIVGNVTFDGGTPLTTSGICYATTINPTTSSSNIPYYLNGANTLTNFTGNLSGLNANTTYYVRAYTTNCAGTTYGNQVSFTTLPLLVPVVTTGAVTSITTTTIVVDNNLIAPNSCTTPTSYGLCWNTATNPTTANSKTINTTPTPIFNDTLTGLTAGVTYYIRAYAINSSGTSYGSQITYMLGTPILTTLAITEIKGNSAKSGGSLVNPGLSGVSTVGLCWSTSPNPTTASSFTTSFTAVMTGMTANTVYYVRAYATNSSGTGYGNQISFNSGYLIGTSIFGGLVFYNDGNSHGVVCAPTDQSTSAIWGCDGVATGANSNPPFTGAANTTAIVTVCGTPGIAAAICNNLVLGSFSDWYLPSVDEVIYMDLYLDSLGLGSFAPAVYWSSTEISENIAYYENFSSNSYSTTNKTGSYRVRAVRSF
jgi:hypothetical protein